MALLHAMLALALLPALLLATLRAGSVGGVLPPTNPPWPPTYQLSQSTLTMVQRPHHRLPLYTHVKIYHD